MGGMPAQGYYKRYGHGGQQNPKPPVGSGTTMQVVPGAQSAFEVH